MNCRDCGGPRDATNPRMRMDICSGCMKIRAEVVKAVGDGRMNMNDFQAYQKNGLRTNRLIKMGHSAIVEAAKARAEGGK